MFSGHRAPSGAVTDVERDGGDGCAAARSHLRPLNCTLKNG